MEDLESSPILNKDIMQELIDVLEQDAFDIFNVFITDSPIQEAQLVSTDTEQEQLILASHSLKSSSAYVGAERLSMLAKQIEIHLKQNEIDDAQTLISQLPALLKESLNQLRIAIDEASA